MQKMKLVIVGNGMVGQRFLEQLVARSDEFEVTTFCEEPRPAYDRVQLTSFFSGRSAADLNVVPERFFQQHAMTLRLNDSVLAIDAARDAELGSPALIVIGRVVGLAQQTGHARLVQRRVA